jgi:hypothetical protein
MVCRDSSKEAVQLKPEDVEGTALFLNGNLILSVLQEPLEQVTDEASPACNVLEEINKRVYSCFDFSNKLIIRSATFVLSQVICDASCTFRQSDKVIAQITITSGKFTHNNLWARH